jgi:hypothetical protein
MESSKKFLRIAVKFIPVLIGALGGFLYYTFIGCNQGCAITGNPLSSTIYGAVVGAFFISTKKKSEEK